MASTGLSLHRYKRQLLLWKHKADLHDAVLVFPLWFIGLDDNCYRKDVIARLKILGLYALIAVQDDHAI
jgi:hypothetical protein